MVMFSKSYCPFCGEAKNLFRKMSINYSVYELDLIKDGQQYQDALAELTGQTTVPNIFIGGQHIGGYSDLKER